MHFLSPTSPIQISIWPNLRFTNRHGGQRRAISTSFPTPILSPPLFSPRVPTHERTPPQRANWKTRRDLTKKKESTPPPQVPGGHSPLLPNPSCSGILKSPPARISIDQPQADRRMRTKDPEMPSTQYQEQTARRPESNSVRRLLSVACARSTGEGLGTGAGRPALSSSPPPHPPSLGEIHAGAASLSTPAPIPKLPTPFGSDGQLFRRRAASGDRARRCWRCECISIETTELSLVFAAAAASPLRGRGGGSGMKGETGPAGAWIFGLLPARNKCQSLFFSGAVRFGKVVKASWSRAVVGGSAIVGICDRGDAPREAGEGCRSPLPGTCSGAGVDGCCGRPGKCPDGMAWWTNGQRNHQRGGPAACPPWLLIISGGWSARQRGVSLGVYPASWLKGASAWLLKV